MVERETLEQFFMGIVEREEEGKAIRADIKEAFAAFADNQSVDLKALREGFKFWKKAQADADEAKTVEFERDKLVEILIAGDVAVVENNS